MTRESRLLLTLTVMAGLGVAGLMLVANQYRKALTTTARRQTGDDIATIRAVRLVDGYLSVRAAVKDLVAERPGTIGRAPADAPEAYRTARWNAFTAHGMTYEDYVAVRAAWRTFRAGGVIEDPALVAAFLARRAQLEQADLGPIEAQDDAIN